jgi:hypothetical protein
LRFLVDKVSLTKGLIDVSVVVRKNGEGCSRVIYFSPQSDFVFQHLLVCLAVLLYALLVVSLTAALLSHVTTICQVA